MNYSETKCFDVFRECVRAIDNGELIVRINQKDKEFHFQNWCQTRLEKVGVHFEHGGRNIYPDFCLVEKPEGYEIKGLAYPGREKDYDANSNVPTGFHNGRTIFYIFGRYPSDTFESEYPIIDLVLCHGDFMNAQHDYVHKNKHIRGFGTYGDIMIRDRKMYVVPTPFALTDGTAGLATLILPENFSVPDGFRCVGDLVRIEGSHLVIGYKFDLLKNQITAEKIETPDCGKAHKFKAYRLYSQTDKHVTMANISNQYKETEGE